MISKKWLFIALLIGNVLLTGIAASTPMYSGAVMQRMLQDELQEYLDDNNAYPGTVSLQFSGAVTRNSMLSEYAQMAAGLPASFGVEPICEISHYYLAATPNTADVVRENAEVNNIAIGMLSDFGQHASIVAGRMYESGRREDGTTEVMVSQKGLVAMNLLLGERRTFSSIVLPDGMPLTVEVVGVFDILDENDPYWVKRPHSYRNETLMSPETFRELFLDAPSAPAINAMWYELLDYTQMQAEDAAQMDAAARALTSYCKSRSYLKPKIGFSDIVTKHISTARKVEVTLWVLQTPVYLLLAAFIFMVSGQILKTEESEIAVLKSRGVNNRQILRLYLTQSVLTALVCVPAGVPLGSLITRAVGSANAFLSFVSRTALPVKIDRTAWLYALAAGVFSVLTMVLPVTRYTRATIVEQKRKKHRSSRPMWQKLYLDVICLGVSLYGLYSFREQREYLAEQILRGAVPDPLLFLCSSLFILGAGLLAVRLLPLPIALVYRLDRRRWSPAMYASYLRVLRQKNSQNFIMAFLVITIALGVFNSQTARAVNQSAEDNTRYLAGADIALTEVWESNADDTAEEPQQDLVYFEPDYHVYADIPGVVSTAKVYRTGATVAVSGGRDQRVTLMGIDTDEFGRTVWFDDSLLPEHLYSYLNALSMNSRAVLVSSNFRSVRGYQLGDVITYSAGGKTLRGYIYGFLDYFPGFAAAGYTEKSDGTLTEVTNYLVVANLSQLQDTLGVGRYSVWLKTDDGADGVYRWIENSQKSFDAFTDAEDEIVEQKNDPMLRSLNGMLTLSFIVALTLCLIGFLIFWILSIRQRTLLFGIYRAMGMTMREIFTMLINEQVCVSLTSAAAGAGIGYLASRLYMPLIALIYTAGSAVLPLNSELSLPDLIRLGIIVAVMLAVCMAALVTIIRRMKIAQALKLGED